MKKLKELKIVLVILLVVLVLVIVKTTGKNCFKEDAKNAIEAVTGNNFLISLNDFKVSENQFLVVDLNKSGSIQFENSLIIPFEKLLEESTIQKVKETKGKILLVSDDNSQTAKAWVILNQMGIKNVFVLANDDNPEVLKYEFQSDTLVE
jgi:hypothetical protein